MGPESTKVSGGGWDEGDDLRPNGIVRKPGSCEWLSEGGLEK